MNKFHCLRFHGFGLYRPLSLSKHGHQMSPDMFQTYFTYFLIRDISGIIAGQAQVEYGQFSEKVDIDSTHDPRNERRIIQVQRRASGKKSPYLRCEQLFCPV